VTAFGVFMQDVEDVELAAGSASPLIKAQPQKGG
jgi:hypothetical protein|tara:strand:+ start:3086 stop:3187 length:102 start_codon:yes stop_codon:yes gene_type:complete